MKLAFDTVLQHLADDRRVKASDVLAHALKRKVWVAEWHMPGCLSESQSICVSKLDAVEEGLRFADGDDGPPRGMKTALIRDGVFQHRTPMFGDVITTVEQHTLADLL